MTAGGRPAQPGAVLGRPAGASPPTDVRPHHKRRPRGGSAGESLTAYGFVAPNMLLLLVFVLVPLVWAVLVSLQQTNGFGTGVFVGLSNYSRLFSDPLFWRSTINTVLFTVIVTPASMGLGLLIAVLLNSALPARGVFRSILITPMAISGVATALLGLLMFDENNGFLDKLLAAIGLPEVSWQSGSTAAFASVVLVTLWWRVGFNMLIYLAGMQSIGPQLYEAARLDGASAWSRLRYVTLPLVGPSSFFLLILNVIYSFQVFDIIFVMTGGGPQNATSVLVTYAYDQGFVTRDQGYAAAIGIVLLIAMLVFTAVQWRSNRNRDVTE